MFLVYQLLFPLVIVGVLIKMIFDGRSSILKETPKQIRQRLGLISPDEKNRLHGTGQKILWIHAASVGEVNAAAPLIQLILASPEPPKILLTTSTASGQKRAEALEFRPDLAVLAPADFYPCVLAFLRRTRPHALLIIETELWPATLKAATRNGLRISIANGRITERSFQRYRWIRGMISPLLHDISLAAVQTAEDAARFVALGFPEKSIHVVGNLKNDIPPPAEDERALAREIFRQLDWTGAPVWAAGSTWPEEEEAVLAAFLQVRQKIPNLKLVLAPRHIERIDETQKYLTASAISTARVSSISAGSGVTTADCLLIDKMGLLRGFYSACDVAFVGGTFNRVGGHNLLEPAIVGKPVLFGPYTESIRDAARTLESEGGGFRVRDSAELGAILQKLLTDLGLRDNAGRQAAEIAGRLAGATLRTWKLLEKQ